MSEGKRISVSDVVDNEVRKLGQNFINQLSIATKVARLYSCEHRNVTEARTDLFETTREFVTKEGDLHLSRYEDFLFVNDVRVKVDYGGYDSYRAVVGMLQERGVGEIVVSESVSEEDTAALIDLMNRTLPEQGGGWEWFSREVSAAGLSHIHLGPEQARREACDDPNEDTRTFAIRTFFLCCHAVDRCFEASLQGRKANLKRLKRCVQSMVDLIQEDSYLLLALTQLKNISSPAANHAVNTALLSVATAARLGLQKKLLGDLGIAALLHDIGKVRLQDQSGPGEHEKHVYYGPQQLLDQRLMNATVKSVNVAFLHHYRFDGTGYPKLLQPKQQNLFTRIVAVANFYDNQTGTGPDAKDPDSVMRELMDRAGTEFDPVVVKAFVNVIGLYPVGCMVQLDTGEIGTVVAPSTDARYLNRPTVRLGIDASGQPIDELANLMQRSGGGFRRSILKVYQQEEIQLELEEYLAVI